jgi:hypothetical protein
MMVSMGEVKYLVTMYQNTRRNIPENNNIHRLILRFSFLFNLNKYFLITFDALHSTGKEKSIDFDTVISCWLCLGLSALERAPYRGLKARLPPEICRDPPSLTRVRTTSCLTPV